LLLTSLITAIIADDICRHGTAKTRILGMPPGCVKKFRVYKGLGGFLFTLNDLPDARSL